MTEERSDSPSTELIVTYDSDPSGGLAYIYLAGPIGRAGIKRTIQVNNDINLDINHDGHLVGIELLDGKLLHPALRARAVRPGGADDPM